jgi:hypothetical protein
MAIKMPALGAPRGIPPKLELLHHHALQSLALRLSAPATESIEAGRLCQQASLIVRRCEDYPLAGGGCGIFGEAAAPSFEILAIGLMGGARTPPFIVADPAARSPWSIQFGNQGEAGNLRGRQT